VKYFGCCRAVVAPFPKRPRYPFAQRCGRSPLSREDASQKGLLDTRCATQLPAGCRTLGDSGTKSFGEVIHVNNLLPTQEARKV
jgi:hypothetical protein